MKEKYTEVDGVLYNEEGNAVFTVEMRKTHTLLVPNMCAVHFGILEGVLRDMGYKVELLHDTDTRAVAEVGLKYIHNDTCYPAILSLGELIRAVQSGKYDVHKVALVMSQTGGGCRASNYLFLLRKALKNAGLEFIPVISVNAKGLGKQPGFTIDLTLMKRLIDAVYFGDLLMSLNNQCEPYEKVRGTTQTLTKEWMDKVADALKGRRPSRSRKKELFREIISSYNDIEITGERKPRVGIVGEIYVKYSPLANNCLERYLIENGAEPVVPGLLGFILYCMNDTLEDVDAFGGSRIEAFIYRLLCNKMIRTTDDIREIMKDFPRFHAERSFEVTRNAAEGIINRGVRMGEGWLLTAEIVDLVEEGVNNVIIVQPFGCLPNHIIGRGTMKRIKELHPEANLLAVDYDASASGTNQENRIRLMLANSEPPNMVRFETE